MTTTMVLVIGKKPVFKQCKDNNIDAIERHLKHIFIFWIFCSNLTATVSLLLSPNIFCFFYRKRT